LISTTIISVGLIDALLGINTLQPRLLLPIHILYLMSLSVTLPSIVTAYREKKRFVRPYETVFLAILLVFNLRSLVILNVLPYYNTRETIDTIQTLKHGTDHELLIFPRYQTITVKYLWGLANPSPPLLAVSDTLHGLSPQADAKTLATHIPLHKPITVVLWPYDAILSPGAQTLVEHLAPRCKKRTEAHLVILNCPPITERRSLYE
jgi:hypothetical protein